jgi:hypothetical protein
MSVSIPKNGAWNPMKPKTWHLAVFTLSFAAGCSGAESGAPAPSPSGPPVFEYENEEVRVDTDLVVPAGKTGRIGPGVTFTAGADLKILVRGVLVIEGSAASPARFAGSGAPSSWYGIQVESGGKLQLQHAEIREARYGIHTLPGSEYEVAYADIGGGFKAAVLESDGTFDHSHFAGATPDSISFAIEVSIDDPNGTMTIMNASPTVTNSQFDGASAVTDMVRIGGESKPVFDHDLFQKAHCGFHNSGAVNNSPIVRNSIFRQLSYGVMAFTTKPVFENNVFEGNTNDVGLCLGATADNAPVLTGNYYVSGSALVDAGCFQIGTADSNPASAPIEGAGPVGL